MGLARRGAASELTIIRVSITVSIWAARTIRCNSECWFETFTYSVRSSSSRGSRESTPMIVSICSKPSSACARRPPQYVDRPVTRTRLLAGVMRRPCSSAHPNQTHLRFASISCRFSWIRARISCETVCTRALSCTASGPPSSTVSIGSRKRILNFAGR